MGRSDQKLVPPRKLADFNNERFTYVMTSLIGHPVKVRMKNNTQVRGILQSCDPAGMNNGEKNDVDITLLHARELPQNNSLSSGVTKTLLISGNQYVAISADTVPHSFSDSKAQNKEKQGFLTDNDIAGKRLRMGHERPLEKWVGDTDNVSLQLENPDTVKEWDQFKENKRKFGVTTTYNDNLYTTKLDVDTIPDHVQEQAHKIADELESRSYERTYVDPDRLAVENMDEEELFSAVGGSGHYKKRESHSRGRSKKTVSLLSNTPLPPAAKVCSKDIVPAGDTENHTTTESVKPIRGSMQESHESWDKLTKMNQYKKFQVSETSRKAKSSFSTSLPGWSSTNAELKGINALNLEPALPKLDEYTINEWVDFKQSQNASSKNPVVNANRGFEKQQFVQALQDIKDKMHKIGIPTDVDKHIKDPAVRAESTGPRSSHRISSLLAGALHSAATGDFSATPSKDHSQVPLNAVPGQSTAKTATLQDNTWVPTPTVSNFAIYTSTAASLSPPLCCASPGSSLATGVGISSTGKKNFQFNPNANSFTPITPTGTAPSLQRAVRCEENTNPPHYGMRVAMVSRTEDLPTESAGATLCPSHYKSELPPTNVFMSSPPTGDPSHSNLYVLPSNPGSSLLSAPLHYQGQFYPGGPTPIYDVAQQFAHRLPIDPISLGNEGSASSTIQQTTIFTKLNPHTRNNIVRMCEFMASLLDAVRQESSFRISGNWESNSNISYRQILGEIPLTNALPPNTVTIAAGGHISHSYSPHIIYHTPAFSSISDPHNQYNGAISTGVCQGSGVPPNEGIVHYTNPLLPGPMSAVRPSPNPHVQVSPFQQSSHTQIPHDSASGTNYAVGHASLTPSLHQNHSPQLNVHQNQKFGANPHVSLIQNSSHQQYSHMNGGAANQACYQTNQPHQPGRVVGHLSPKGTHPSLVRINGISNHSNGSPKNSTKNPIVDAGAIHSHPLHQAPQPHNPHSPAAHHQNSHHGQISQATIQTNTSSHHLESHNPPQVPAHYQHGHTASAHFPHTQSSASPPPQQAQQQCLAPQTSPPVPHLHQQSAPHIQQHPHQPHGIQRGLHGVSHQHHHSYLGKQPHLDQPNHQPLHQLQSPPLPNQLQAPQPNHM